MYLFAEIDWSRNFDSCDTELPCEKFYSLVFDVITNHVPESNNMGRRISISRVTERRNNTHEVQNEYDIVNSFADQFARMFVRGDNKQVCDQCHLNVCDFCNTSCCPSLPSLGISVDCEYNVN